MGYSPWGRKESDMTERLHFHFQTRKFKFFKKVYTACMLQKDTIRSYQNEISMPHTQSGSYNSKYLC